MKPELFIEKSGLWMLSPQEAQPSMFTLNMAVNSASYPEAGVWETEENTYIFQADW